jgi:hypothetical protein
MRRGRVFYFRKRLPRIGSNRQSNLFLCLSLQTDLPLDAVKRAAALLTVYEREEEKIVDALKTGTLGPADVRTILTEMMRAELRQIHQGQNATADLGDAELDARVAALETENKSLRRASRQANWEGVRSLLTAAGRLAGISMTEEIDADLGRQAVSLKRRLNEVEIDGLEGDDIRYSARPLLNDHGVDDFDAFVSTPITATAAFRKVRELYPSKAMQGNISALETLFMEYFGDVPMTSIHKEQQKAFFAWMARLPKYHGKAHGVNKSTKRNDEKKFEKTGVMPERTKITKAQEIAEADARDYAITEEIRALEGVSVPEKRARLADKLVPRLTLRTLKRNRDGLSRLLKAAAELGAKAPEVLSYPDLERHLKALSPNDDLYIRVTKPKTRLPWSKERLASFLTCPIFTGSSSAHRRWKPGRVVVRDATYWVPLLVLTLGSRIEEILLLKTSDVIQRDGQLCLSLNFGPEQTGKNESAQRILPVPDLLLQLGFREWFHSLPDRMMLFPEALARSESRDVTSAFGKHLQNILKRLGLSDFQEDFYASRKTLLTMLEKADVEEGRRQAIAGHRQGKIINIHYTAHDVEALKCALDKADFKVEIKLDPKLGFPVIQRCNLGGKPMLDLDVTLGDAYEAKEVTVYKSGDAAPMFKYEAEASSCREKRRQAALALKDVARDYALRMPSNAEKRRAVEHLMAYA